MPFRDETKAEIARELVQYVRSLIKAGEHGEMLRTLSAARLARLTRSAGYETDLDRICAIPDGLLQREKHFRTVATFNRDRKAYEDTVRPRIKRTRVGMLPMEMVVGDVHPIDIACLRPDGSTVFPKAIAWLDLATNRIHADVVFLEPGKGIRNADVIRSFGHMCDRWGLPTSLYLDNGSEYNWAEFVDDALKLVAATGNSSATVGYVDDRVSRLVRAKPYNASAKPIEGIFGLLEGRHFSAIPGWVGGDRMRQKSANIGKSPDPFPGTYDELARTIGAMVELYHNQPQKRGSLKGRSPYGALQRAIDDGWQMTKVEQGAFAVAFSVPEVREVRQNRIRHDGDFWSCDELDRYLDDKVTILVPKFEKPSRLLIQGRDGKTIGVAERVREYGFREQAGAREADRSVRRKVRAVRELDRSVPTISPLDERLALANLYPAAPNAKIGAVIAASDKASLIHESISKTQEERFDAAHRERQKQLAADNARMEEFYRRTVEGKT